jgi:hypothetical protein
MLQVMTIAKKIIWVIVRQCQILRNRLLKGCCAINLKKYKIVEKRREAPLFNL